jgi:hypothetical protein
MTAAANSSDGVLLVDATSPVAPSVDSEASRVPTQQEGAPVESSVPTVSDENPSPAEAEVTAGSENAVNSMEAPDAGAPEIVADSPAEDGAKQPAERLTSGSSGNNVAVVAIVKRSPTTASPENNSSNGTLSSPLSSGSGLGEAVDPREEAVKKYNEAKARIFSDPVNSSAAGEADGGEGPSNEDAVQSESPVDASGPGIRPEVGASGTAAPANEGLPTPNPSEGIPPNVGTPVSITVGVNPRKAAPRGFVAAEEQEEYRRESHGDGRGRNGRGTGGHQDPYQRRPQGATGMPGTASHQPYANTVLGTQPPAVQVPVRGQQPPAFPNPAMPGFFPTPPPQFPQSPTPQVAPPMRYPTGQPYLPEGTGSMPLSQPTMPFANPGALPPQTAGMLPGGFPAGFPPAAGPLLGTTSVKFGIASSQAPTGPSVNASRPPINVEAPRVGLPQHNSYATGSSNAQPAQPFYPPPGASSNFRPDSNPTTSLPQGQFYSNSQHQGATGYASTSQSQSHREGHDRDRGGGNRREGNSVYSNPQIATPPFQGPGYPGTVTVGSSSTSPLEGQQQHQSTGYNNYPMAPQQLPHSSGSAPNMSGVPSFQGQGMVPNPQLGMAGLALPGSVPGGPLVGPPPPAHQLFPSMAQEADFGADGKQRHQRYSHDSQNTRRRGGRGGNQRQDGDGGHGGMMQDDGSYGQGYAQHQQQPEHQQQFQQQPQFQQPQHQPYQQQYLPQHSYSQPSQGFGSDANGVAPGNQQQLPSQSQSQHYDGSRDRDGNRSGGRGRGGRGHTTRSGGNPYQSNDGAPPAPAYPTQHDSMYYQSSGANSNLPEQHQHGSGHSSMNYSRAGAGQSMQPQSQPQSQSYSSGGSKQSTPTYPGYDAPPRPPPGFPTPPGPQTTGYYASGSSSLPPPPPPPPPHSQSSQYSPSSGYSTGGIPAYGSSAPPPPPPPAQQSPYPSTHSGMSQWAQPAFLPPPLQPHQTQGAPPPPPPPPPPPLNSSPVAYAPTAPTPEYNPYPYSAGASAPPYSAGNTAGQRQSGGNSYSSSSGQVSASGSGYSQQHSSNAQPSSQMMHSSSQHHSQSQNHHSQHQGYNNTRGQHSSSQGNSTGPTGSSGNLQHQQHQQQLSSGGGGGGKNRSNTGPGMYPQTYSPGSTSSGGSPHTYPPNPVQPQSIDGYIPQERVSRPTAPQAVGVTSGGPSTPVNFGAPSTTSPNDPIEKRLADSLNRSGRAGQDDATPNVVQRVRK